VLKPEWWLNLLGALRRHGAMKVIRWRQVVVGIVCVALGWPSVTVAQGETKGRVPLSKSQIQRYKDAIAEFDREDSTPDYRVVEAKLRELIKEKEVDIFYFSLGRVLFFQERCAEAEVAYKKARNTPNSTEYNREEIQRDVELDLAKMPKKCNGSISIECSPETLEVLVGEQPVACGDKVEVSPGEWSVSWKLGRHRGEQTVQVVGMRDSPLRLEVSRESTSLTVHCQPRDMQVWINQQTARCDVPQAVEPGEYEIKGLWAHSSRERELL
jgi:hypothetical protein